MSETKEGGTTTDLFPPWDIVLLRVEFQEREHVCDGGGRGGAAEDDVEQHPVDAQRVVVEGDGEALAELDELADLLEGPVTVRGYDVLNRLRGEEERTKSLNLCKRT